MVTLVTGPPRSGTSCLTSLLECCGFDLGRRIRILRHGTDLNPHGHLEPDLLVTINNRLLFEASHNARNYFGLLTSRTRGAEGDITCIADPRSLADLAPRRTAYFQLFVREFDGELCKDPLMCLTLPLWEERWPALRQAVFCLRHPLAVARSMAKRYGLAVEEGLALWHSYASRFFDGVEKCQVVVFDFDAFCRSPAGALAGLLDSLGRSVPRIRIQACLDELFAAGQVHWSGGTQGLDGFPGEVRELYTRLRSRTE